MRKWFKTYYRDIVVILLIMNLIPVSIVFWFYSDAYLIWNPDNFNNIVTPIATILFSALVYWITRKQSEVAASQNLKYNFEKQIENIKENFKNQYAGGLNCFEIQEQLFSLAFVKNDPDFLVDFQAIANGHPEPRQYYEGRSYYPHIKGLMNYLNMGLPHFHPTLTLLKTIRVSKMLETDTSFIRQRVQSELITGYMFAHPFVVQFGAEIPIIYFVNEMGHADYYKNTPVYKHYADFEKALSTD